MHAELVVPYNARTQLGHIQPLAMAEPSATLVALSFYQVPGSTASREEHFELSADGAQLTHQIRRLHTKVFLVHCDRQDLIDLTASHSGDRDGYHLTHATHALVKNHAASSILNYDDVNKRVQIGVRDVAGRFYPALFWQCGTYEIGDKFETRKDVTKPYEKHGFTVSDETIVRFLAKFDKKRHIEQVSFFDVRNIPDNQIKFYETVNESQKKHLRDFKTQTIGQPLRKIGSSSCSPFQMAKYDVTDLATANLLTRVKTDDQDLLDDLLSVVDREVFLCGTKLKQNEGYLKVDDQHLGVIVQPFSVRVRSDGHPDSNGGVFQNMDTAHVIPHLLDLYATSDQSMAAFNTKGNKKLAGRRHGALVGKIAQADEHILQEQMNFDVDLRAQTYHQATGAFMLKCEVLENDLSAASTGLLRACTEPDLYTLYFHLCELARLYPDVYGATVACIALNKYVQESSMQLFSETTAIYRAMVSEAFAAMNDEHMQKCLGVMRCILDQIHSMPGRDIDAKRGLSRFAMIAASGKNAVLKQRTTRGFPEQLSTRGARCHTSGAGSAAQVSGHFADNTLSSASAHAASSHHSLEAQFEDMINTDISRMPLRHPAGLKPPRPVRRFHEEIQSALLSFHTFQRIQIADSSETKRAKKDKSKRYAERAARLVIDGRAPEVYDQVYPYYKVLSSLASSYANLASSYFADGLAGKHYEFIEYLVSRDRSYI